MNTKEIFVDRIDIETVDWSRSQDNLTSPVFFHFFFFSKQTIHKTNRLVESIVVEPVGVIVNL